MDIEEKKLYAPIKEFLDEHFSKLGVEHYFEITAKNISDKIKREFNPLLLLSLKTEKTLPDIMGFVEKNNSKELYVFEVKNSKPSIGAIYQVKKYAEVLNAKYAYLVCTKEISTELREILKTELIIQSYNTGHGTISIIHFDEKKKQILPNFCLFGYKDPLQKVV